MCANGVGSPGVGRARYATLRYAPYLRFFCMRGSLSLCYATVRGVA